jgi:hypothetical protein
LSKLLSIFFADTAEKGND